MKYKHENDLTVEQLIKVYEESEEIVGDVKELPGSTGKYRPVVVNDPRN